MRCYPVRTRINHVANDDESCSAPVELAQIQNRPPCSEEGDRSLSAHPDNCDCLNSLHTSRSISQNLRDRDHDGAIMPVQTCRLATFTITG